MFILFLKNKNLEIKASEFFQNEFANEIRGDYSFIDQSIFKI